MDLHVVPGLTPEMVAQGHAADLKVQDEFNCKCITYWVDVERGRAFCLAEAPTKEDLRKTHLKALGVAPIEIIEVDDKVVNMFLGRLKDPETYLIDGLTGLKIFNDPAFRIVLVCTRENTKLLEYKYGKPNTKRWLKDYKTCVRDLSEIHGGREIRSEEFVLSFRTVFKAVECALDIQKQLKDSGEKIGLQMSLHGGLPVTKNKQIFGDVINYAKFICKFSNSAQIVISPMIREMYKREYEKLLANEGITCINTSEDLFTEMLAQTLYNNWQNPEFRIEDFCRQMSVSKSELYRKSVSLTGMSINALLKEFRLQKALELFDSNNNISETAFDSGFSSPSYFTKCFQKRFGIQPKELLKN